MKKTHWVFTLSAAALALAGAYGLYRFNTHMPVVAVYDLPAASSAAQTASSATSQSTTQTTPKNALPQNVAEGEEATRRHVAQGIKAGDIDPDNGGKVLYYQDPMVPGNRFDKPGKSPFMDMMLVPVYSGADSDSGSVTVSSRIQQNLGVRTAEVSQGSLSPHISAVGNIALNERDQVVMQARASGFIERLHVRSTMEKVRKGQALVDVYVPEWVAAQEEFLSLKRFQGAEASSLVDAAKQRMRQVGMSEAQIQEVVQAGAVQPRTTLRAPMDGVVLENLAREGMAFSAGATLFRINSLSSVWAEAELPESQVAFVRVGAQVQAKSSSEAKPFKGQVIAVLPEVNPATRTVKVRMALRNAGEHLLPGMFVQMQFTDPQSRHVLLIPSEALIQTGKRTVVLVAEAGGKFRPVEVDIGIENAGLTEIKSGLRLREQVVVSSQFLIDSEASLKGVEARLNGQEGVRP